MSLNRLNSNSSPRRADVFTATKEPLGSFINWQQGENSLQKQK